MNHWLLRCSLLIVSLAPSLSQADTGAIAQAMLNQFASGCTNTAGVWTTAALGYATNLAKTMADIRDDPDCQSLSGALSNVSNLSEVVTSLQEDQNQRSLDSLKKQEQEYLSFLAATNDPTERATLISELQATEVSIAQYKANQKDDQKYQKQVQLGNGLQAFLSSSKILMAQASKNELCMKKNPDFLAGLAGVIGSFGSNSVIGAVSLVAATGVDLINSLIVNGKNKKINRRISHMLSSETAAAYQCVLETLSTQWCTARDAETEIKLVANSVAIDSRSTELDKTNGLILHEAPQFLNWLDTVNAGTIPTSSATATRQDLVQERSNEVAIAKHDGPGLIGDAKSAFLNPLNSAEEQWQIELGTIGNIVTSFLKMDQYGNQTGPNTPMKDVLGSNAVIVAPWFLIGVNVNSIPNASAANPYANKLSTYTLTQLIASGVVDPKFTPDMTALQNNVKSWLDKSQARSDQEKNVIITTAPKLVLGLAKTKDTKGASPFLALLKLIDFFQDLKDDPSNATFVSIYKDNIGILKTIACEIDSFLPERSTVKNDETQKLIAKELLDCPSPTGSVDAQQIVTDISSIAKLDNGIEFISTQLNWALKQKSDSLLLANQSGLTDAETTLLLARTDYVSDIASYTTKVNYNGMTEDLDGAESTLSRTLKLFGEEFGAGIAQVLFDAKADGPAGEKQTAKICTLLLAAPIWPSAIPPELCYGAVMTSVFSMDVPNSTPSNPELRTKPITQEIINGKFEDRVCTYRDHDRKNMLYQKLLGAKVGSKK